MTRCTNHTSYVDERDEQFIRERRSISCFRYWRWGFKDISDRKGIFKLINYCHRGNNLCYRVFLQERKSAGEVLNMWLVFGFFSTVGLGNFFGIFPGFECISRYPPSAKTTRLCDYNPCSISTGGVVCTAKSQAHRWVAMQ